MVINKLIYVIRNRPTYIYPYVRQTSKFFITRMMYKLFTPKNIFLGRNVRIQEYSMLRVEVPKSEISIGDNCILWEKSRIEAISGGKIEIGSYTEIARSTIVAKGLIKIGNYVGMAHNTYIQDFLGHPSNPETRMLERKRRLDWFYPNYDSPLRKRDKKQFFDPDIKPVIIHDNVMIYRNVLISRGVTIGRGSVIAANSVVTCDIPPYTFVAGNPGKIVKFFQKPMDML